MRDYMNKMSFKNLSVREREVISILVNDPAVVSIEVIAVRTSLPVRRDDEELLDIPDDGPSKIGIAFHTSLPVRRDDEELLDYEDRVGANWTVGGLSDKTLTNL